MSKLILAAMMLAACAAQAAPASDLEQLFEAGQYRQFFARANPLAEKGDPTALFLLGKAHHLGKGTEVDTASARGFYSRAAQSDHPRALHNLGLIMLEQERSPTEAIPLFEQALKRGLTTPTLSNLGRAHKSMCVDTSSEASCTTAAGIFTDLWEKNKDTFALDEAVVVFASMCFSSGSRQVPPTPECKRAMQWAEKGAALGLGRSAYNRGAIEVDAQRHAAAMPWFRLATDKGEGLGAYSIGKMYEDGLGVSKNQAEMLAWFKRGAVLKNAYAVERMTDYWHEQVRVAPDQTAIRAAAAELAKLKGADYVSSQAQERIRTMDTLAANVRTMPALAKKDIDPIICQLTSGEYGLDWWIVPMAPGKDGNEEQNRLTRGTVDAKGCVTISAAGLAAVRKHMALGKTPVLHWPGQGRLLSLVPGPGGKLTFLAETTQYQE